ncbi:hypothetical protein N9V21_00330 [Candidatus Marinimicrobia bacterium]|jgi:hypothetical protein|nr:hypothetical protein [Candidatus Neomarinimicrobiota bacterium]MDA9735378.1 hypothetical protein [Candidatus Neomarinimicrobiota bacterium]
MIKKLLILLLFFGFTYSQNVVSINNLVERDGIIYRFVEYEKTIDTNNLVPYSGRVYVRTEKIDLGLVDLMNSETPEVLKKLVWVQLSLKGTRLEEENITSFISREFSVKNGILDGEFQEWNQFGIKTLEKKYNKGKLIGKFISRDNYGKVITESNYNTEGKLDGYSIKYETDSYGYSTEKLDSKGNYKNGLKEGEWEIGTRGFKQYFKDGEKVRKPKN